MNNNELNMYLLEVIERLPLHTPEINFCHRLMFATGCRASEAIDMTRWSIDEHSNVLLQPLKNNNTRKFSLLDVDAMIGVYLIEHAEFRKFVNYRKLQYSMRQSLVKMNVVNGDKSSLLHLYRHNYAKQKMDTGWSLVQLQIDFGHKDVNSTLNYVNSVIEYI